MLNDYGNELADKFAKAGADLGAASLASIAAVNFYEGRAHLIRSRLIAVQKAILDDTESLQLEQSAAVVPRRAMASVKRKIHSLAQEQIREDRMREDGSVRFLGHASHRIIEADSSYTCCACGASVSCWKPRYTTIIMRSCSRRPSSAYHKGIIDNLPADGVVVS